MQGNTLLAGLLVFLPAPKLHVKKVTSSLKAQHLACVWAICSIRPATIWMNASLYNQSAGNNALVNDFPAKLKSQIREPEPFNHFRVKDSSAEKPCGPHTWASSSHFFGAAFLKASTQLIAQKSWARFSLQMYS